MGARLAGLGSLCSANIDPFRLLHKCVYQEDKLHFINYILIKFILFHQNGAKTASSY